MQPEVENEKIERAQGGKNKEISDRKAKKPHERRNGWGCVHKTIHGHACGEKGEWNQQ